MTGFIDTTIRVEKEKHGDLVEIIETFAKYAKFVNHEVVIPSDDLKQRAALVAGAVIKHAPKQIEHHPKRGRDTEHSPLSPAQKKVLSIIIQGHKTAEAIKEVAGMGRLGGVLRTINNLKKKKRIVVTRGECFPLNKD